MAPALALSFGILLGSSSLVWGTEVADLVESYGLLPMEPPPPAVDFELPRAGGGSQSLSDFAGSWTILTFWATWCGPCRAEMPSLERLHRSHRDKGVVVLGVAVDRSQAVVDAFIEEYELTFPQVWDQNGSVGSLYQATAIPMSYLIDPRGRIVGLSRGARDWTELAGLMDGLIERIPVDSTAENDYAAKVELPRVADPPSAEVVLSQSSPRAGQQFFLDVRLHWSGDVGEYLPHPPKVLLPEGVTEKGVTASTSSRDGAQVVVYRIALQADEPGSYALDPIELRYQPRFAADVATSRVLGPTVIVEPRSVAGLRPRVLATGAVGAVVAAVLGLGFARRFKVRADDEPEEGQRRFDNMQTRYSEARNLRMQGDGAGFALVMLELLKELREPSDDETSEIAALEESLRFGGQVPAASELDRLQREVTRRLESVRPDPDAAARGALRLQEDEEIV